MSRETQHLQERWVSCFNPTYTELFLEACLSENAKSYVRRVSIDPENRRRVTETIIQRPNGEVATA